MSIFLIDYENVRTAAFNGLEDLTEEDRVIIFYTSNSDNLTFALMQRLIKAKAEINYLKVSCGGKNSLDFQLCSYLGFLIGTNRDTRFCIISRDKGFSTMLSLWGENTENGNSVICCTNIYNGSGSKPIEEEEIMDTQEMQDEVAPETYDEAENAPEPSAQEPSLVSVAESAEEKPSEKAESKPEVAKETADAAPEAVTEEKTENKPKRQYKRRTYNRKPKAPASEQTA